MENGPVRIQEFMTACPLTLPSSESIATAAEKMREKGIRHIPVVDENRLSGLISDRDIELVLSLDVDPRHVTVGTVMSHDPFVVTPETPLKDVVTRMMKAKFDAAVVVQNGGISGIFTTVDALSAFSRLL